MDDRAAGGFVYVGVIGLVMFSLLLVPLLRWMEIGQGVVDPTEVDIPMTFDFGRLPLTRTATVDLDLPEVGTRVGLATADGEPGGDEQPVQVSAALERDILARQGRGEFPAQQVSVAVASATSQSATITVTADPGQPELVSGGLYDGVITLSLPDGTPAGDDVAIRLLLRDRRALAGGAFLVIFMGALLGLALKWLTETATDLGRYRREHRRLSRRFPRGVAPSWVSQRLDDAFELIRDGETSAIDEILGPVRKRSEEIDNFRREYEQALQRLDDVEADAPPHLAAEVPALRRQLERLRAKATQERVEGEDAQSFADLHGRLQELEARIQQSNADAPGSGDRRPTPSRLWWRSSSPSPTQQRDPRGAVAEEPPAPVRLAEFLSDHVRPTLAFMSALVVAIVGVQVEVVSDPAFTGSASDFMGIALWALAVEFTGVSLTEVIGKMQPSAHAA